MDALRMAWEATDHPCSRRLQPFLPELVGVLQRCGHCRISAEVAARLCRMSPSTIDRLLRPWRRSAAGHRFSVTRPGTLHGEVVPVRAFEEWDEARPGFLVVDLVEHCGVTDDGLYITSVCAVDVATGWWGFEVVWGRKQDRICEAIDRLRQRLPVPLLGLDSDVSNRSLLVYCRTNQISFVRSRPYRSIDLWRPDRQKWSIARRVIGRGRYSGKEALEALEQVYGVLHLYLNFFQPTTRVTGRIWTGSKMRRLYDSAQTPYRRVLASGLLSGDTHAGRRQELAAIYDSLNPILLRQQLDDSLKRLRGLAATSPFDDEWGWYR